MSTRLSGADYVAAGFALVPIPIGHKNPIAPGWQIEQNAIRTIEQADRLNGGNIGIAHRWCGNLRHRAKLLYRLPDGVPWLPLIPALGKGSSCAAAKDGASTVTDVLPPSIHELTHIISHTSGPGSAIWRDPPELPAEILALWRELAKLPSRLQAAARASGTRQGARGGT